MMRKIIPVGIAIVVILSGFGALGSSGKNAVTIAEMLSFSAPTILPENEYITIGVNDVTSQIMTPGLPMLPKVVKVFDLPFASTNVRIECVPLEFVEQAIQGTVRPAPQPVPLLENQQYAVVEDVINDAVYTSHELFPTSWYSYQLTGGANKNGELVMHATVYIYPVRYVPAENRLIYATQIAVNVFYEPPENPRTFGDSYDLVIIAPKKFSDDLQPLIDHKISHGMNTTLKTTQEIYREYKGVDKPEKIKYFIKDAIEQFGIRYVLLVGGLNNYFYANDRENANTGSRWWNVPVRYTNLFDGGDVQDPGYLSDLYYADIYDDKGNFSSWDSNGDGIFASWGRPNASKDKIDLDPDVAVGRLACANKAEVKAVVDKIIRYETTAEEEWVKKMIVISGDGFQDQDDLDIEWNVGALPNGQYTIYAQSNNSAGQYGSVDIINVTVNHDVPSVVTFVEDDHLTTQKMYPALPVAEITSPSEGNILGNSNVNFLPPKAYLGEYWARVEYMNGLMKIRGKSYDPQPFGSATQIRVWIKNSAGDEILNTTRDSAVYFEGEMETWKALGYLPDDFIQEILWSSNGNFTSQDDVLEAMNAGSGFVYFAGHGSPRVWANHYPGIPGGRANSSIVGLSNFEYNKLPFFPMSKLANGDKLPIVVVGGCHNSQFNVTLLKTLLRGPTYWTYGIPVAECWSWVLVRLSHSGAIATMGSTGLGYGILGKDCVSGLGGWMDSEFFRVVSEKYNSSIDPVLGDIYRETLSNYVSEFSAGSDKTDCKTVQEWALLGDPSLMIGGYSS